VLTMLRRLVFLVSAGMKEGWKKIGTKLWRDCIYYRLKRADSSDGRMGNTNHQMANPSHPLHIFVKLAVRGTSGRGKRKRTGWMPNNGPALGIDQDQQLNPSPTLRSSSSSESLSDMISCCQLWKYGALVDHVWYCLNKRLTISRSEPAWL
jgi:hypothetical protein